MTAARFERARWILGNLPDQANTVVRTQDTGGGQSLVKQLRGTQNDKGPAPAAR